MQYANENENASTTTRSELKDFKKEAIVQDRPSKKLNKVIQSLLWTFFPLAVVIFILWLLGIFTPALIRTDVILLSSVLFVDHWWKVRKLSLEDQDSWEIFGIFGIVSSIIATTLLLIEESMLKNINQFYNDDNLRIAATIIFVLSVIYAFCVRFMELGLKSNEE